MSRPDAIVIGAGIVGAACAAELAREGFAVEVVDAHGIGQGATAEGMGHLVVLDGSPAELALSRFSAALWQDLVDHLPPACEVSACGTLWVAERESELELLAAKHRTFRSQGVGSALLGASELTRVEPCLRAGLPGALRVPGDSVVYPPAAAEALLCAPFGREIRLRRAMVLGVQGGTEDRDPEVILSCGTRRSAGWIVDAAGPRALDLLPEPLPGACLRPRKGHLLITDRHPGFCRHQLVEVGYLDSVHTSTGASVAFNLQPRPNGQLLLGSSRQLGVTSRTVESEVVARMVNRASGFVPGLESLEILRIWCGFRAATDDHLPLIGPVPGYPRVLLAAGHEGLGVTTALATGRLLADHLVGRESAIDPAPYLPARAAEGLEAHA